MNNQKGATLTDSQASKVMDNLAANVPLIVSALNSFDYGDLVIKKHAGRIILIERTERIQPAE